MTTPVPGRLRLSQEEFDELSANAWMVDAAKGQSSMISRHHWRGATGRLARRKFVTWTTLNRGPFVLVKPTELGREALRLARAAGMVETPCEPNPEAGYDD